MPSTHDAELGSLLEAEKEQSTYQVTTARAKAACLDLFKPSLRIKDHQHSMQALGRTAYLDGLRGFAALLVFSLHHQRWGHSGSVHEIFLLEKGFGVNNEYYFICFPGIRILFSGGHVAVAIFFIISGYVLSANPLNLIHERETARLADNIGSALFRRWIRLFLPVLAVTFLWMASWHIFGIKSSNSWADAPERTFVDEFWKWYYDFKNFSFIFTDNYANKYNDHTWSIPLEFRGSVVVYTSLLAFARCRRNVRLYLEAGLIFYFLYIVDGWYCALFCMGILLSDLDLLAERDELPQIFSRLRRVKGWIFYVALAVSLYLGGVPAHSDDIHDVRNVPGWYLLSFLKPQAVYDFRWFFRFWAATLAMISIPRIPWAKGFFETSFCQYLGKISFSFYLVHGPVLWSIGDRVYAACGRVRESSIEAVPEWNNLFRLPIWGPVGLEINFIVPCMILLALTLWLAEIVTKMIDEPSNRFARWLFNSSVKSRR